MSGRLPHLVGSVTPLGAALDGTPRKKQRRPTRRPAKPEVDASFVCRCGYRTDDQRDYQAHLLADIDSLKTELSALAKTRTANEVAEILNTSVSFVRRLCRRGVLIAEQRGPMWLIDENSAIAYIDRDRRYSVKLSRSQAEEIRLALDAGAKGAELARQYGVSETAISRIRQARTWQQPS